MCTKGDDKLEVLKRVLERFKARQLSTLVFCNTVASCRAVEYALNETEIGVLSYHGDLNSKDRAENLERFRAGEFKCLVCSGIA
jgi:superfamily II DNA/RNA helicase